MVQTKVSCVLMVKLLDRIRR